MLVDIGHKQLFPVPLAEQQHESQRLREGWACISHHRGVSGTEAMEALVQRTECPKTAQGWTSRLRGTSSGPGPGGRGAAMHGIIEYKPIRILRGWSYGFMLDYAP